jgi:hypothetical protein
VWWLYHKVHLKSPFNGQCWYQSVKAGLEGEFAMNRPTADTSRQAEANCVNQPGLCDLCWHFGMPNTLPCGGASPSPWRLWIGALIKGLSSPECQRAWPLQCTLPWVEQM